MLIAEQRKVTWKLEGVRRRRLTLLNCAVVVYLSLVVSLVMIVRNWAYG